MRGAAGGVAWHSAWCCSTPIGFTLGTHKAAAPACISNWILRLECGSSGSCGWNAAAQDPEMLSSCQWVECCRRARHAAMHPRRITSLPIAALKPEREGLVAVVAERCSLGHCASGWGVGSAEHVGLLGDVDRVHCRRWPARDGSMGVDPFSKGVHFLCQQTGRR